MAMFVLLLLIHAVAKIINTIKGARLHLAASQWTLLALTIFTLPFDRKHRL